MNTNKSPYIEFGPRPFFSVRLWLGHARQILSTAVAMEGAMRVQILLNRLAVCIVYLAILLVVAVAVVGIALKIYPYTSSGEARWAALQSMDECSTSIRLEDSDGEYVGHIPAALMHPRNICKELDDAGWTSHSTSYVPHPPQLWDQMLNALEDRRRQASWWLLNINGFDFPSASVAVLSAMRGRPVRGASSIPMQLSRTLQGTLPGPHENLTLKLKRKRNEVLDATVLTHNLGGANSPQLNRWVARHMPCAQPARHSRIGGSVFGLYACSQIMFDKIPSKLSDEETAILVASTKHQLLLAPGDRADDQAASRKRWTQKIRPRARLALDRVFYKDDPRLSRAKAALNQMDMPTPVLAPAFRELLSSDPVEHIGVSGLPAKRAARYIKGEIINLQGELYDLFATVPSSLVGIKMSSLVGIKMAVPAAANAKWKAAAERILQLEERNPNNRLSLPLPPASSNNAVTNAITAEVSISLVDQRGRVVRHYSSPNDRIFAGANSKRDQNNRYIRELEDRSIGSVAKMLAALALGARFKISDALCEQWLGGLSNSDGSQGFRECSSPQAWIDIKNAFSESNNLAIAWGLRRIQEKELKELVKAAGLGFPQDDVPLSTGVAMGQITGDLRALHRLAAALNRGARGLPAQASLPTLIDTLFFRKTDGKVEAIDFEAVRERSEIDLSAWFRHRRVQDFVADALEAPTQPGGTLHGLREILRRVAGARQVIAKSGTAVTDQKAIRDQLIVSSWVDRRGQQLTATLLVGSPDPNQPLADRGGLRRSARLSLFKSMLLSYYEPTR